MRAALVGAEKIGEALQIARQGLADQDSIVSLRAITFAERRVIRG